MASRVAAQPPPEPADLPLLFKVRPELSGPGARLMSCVQAHAVHHDVRQLNVCLRRVVAHVVVVVVVGGGGGVGVGVGVAVVVVVAVVVAVGGGVVVAVGGSGVVVVGGGAVVVVVRVVH